MSEERGLEDIVLAMGRHNSDVELVEAACSALWSLSMEGNISYLSWGAHHLSELIGHTGQFVNGLYQFEG